MLAANVDDLQRHVQKLCEQVRALNIPNSDSSYGVVTTSIGGAHHLPDRESTEAEFIQLDDKALFAALISPLSRHYTVQCL